MSKFKQIPHPSFFKLLQVKTTYKKDNALIYIRMEDIRDIFIWELDEREMSKKAGAEKNWFREW